MTAALKEVGEGDEMTPFEGLDETLMSILKTKFNVSKLYNFQQEILLYLLKSFVSPSPCQDGVANDLCVYVPTGYGKTLAYVLPSLSLFLGHPDRISLPGVQVMVLVPTKELVNQVFHVFRTFVTALTNGICVAALTGDLKESKEKELLRGGLSPKKRRLFTAGEKAASTGPHILVALASRISAHVPPVAETPSFLSTHLRLLIVDEADRLLEQSYGDWLFAVKSLCEEKDRCRGVVPRVDHLTRNLSRSILQYGTCFNVAEDSSAATASDLEGESVWRKNIYQALMPCPLHKIALTATNVQNYKGFGLLMMNNPIQITGILKEKELERIRHWYIKGLKTPELVGRLIQRQARRNKKEKILIFCSTDSHCQWLRNKLRALALAVDVLSSGRNSKERRDVLSQFRKGDSALEALICTDLASRGLDIDMVRTVIHYELPQTAESYVHRVGRAGRAGRKGRSFALVENTSQVRTLVKVIKGAQKHRACTLKRYVKLD